MWIYFEVKRGEKREYLKNRCRCIFGNLSIYVKSAMFESLAGMNSRASVLYRKIALTVHDVVMSFFSPKIIIF